MMMRGAIFWNGVQLCKEITEGLFRKYSTLWQHKYESPITVSKIYTLAGAPLKFEALGFSLSIL